MRIFYAADHQPFPGNNLWHNNLYLPLIDLGHEVVPFHYDLSPHFANADPSFLRQRLFIDENRPKLENELLKQIEVAHHQKKIDVFFSYFYNAHCRPEIINEIKKMGICTINWYCNASYQFHLVNEIAPAFDYCLVPEKFRLEDYRTIGANPIYCQEAANPNIYKPYDVEREFAVTFIGQKYGDRPELIKTLLNANVPVKVWGAGWIGDSKKQTQDKKFRLEILKYLFSSVGVNSVKRKIYRSINRMNRSPIVSIPVEICNLPLSDQELVKMFSRSSINLGFSDVNGSDFSGKIPRQVRLRDFEVPMSGGFYMVQYMSELEEFFEIGKEIVCFDGINDISDKVKFYLAHDSKREKIRNAGFLRARKDHTWQKRLSFVFKTIGLTDHG